MFDAFINREPANLLQGRCAVLVGGALTVLCCFVLHNTIKSAHDKSIAII